MDELSTKVANKFSISEQVSIAKLGMEWVNKHRMLGRRVSWLCHLGASRNVKGMDKIQNGPDRTKGHFFN